jgi:hypothetical protein
MSKILPSQLTEAEILALLDSEEDNEPQAEIFDYTDDIVPFLGFYKITPGVTLVSKKLLYNLYQTYSKQPLPLLDFNIQVGRFLTPSRHHYSINMDQFAISNHIYKAEKTRDKTKSLSYQKHFDWFLTEKKVEKGTSWIEGFILFFIYKDFCKSRRVNPKFGYVNFHKFLKLNFQFKRLKENRSLWFRVDESTATIYNEEFCEKIRSARAKKTRGSKEEVTEEPNSTKAE